MKKLLFFYGFILTYSYVQSQGCIMVRNISGFGQYNLTDNAFTVSRWQLNINSRYFKAFRDFKGKADQKTLKQDQSIVYSYTMDITVSRMMENGWSMDFSLPISSNSRSATLEHGGPGTTRHSTHTFGVGDIRLTVYKWLFRPSVSQKANLQLGLGIKLPTGDYKYQDYFYRNDTTKVLAPVNASIGLGDGGTGLITELNAFFILIKSISFYGNFYYLTNPRDQSGVSTTNGKPPPELLVKTGADIYSVPDIYSMRAGLNYNFRKLTVSAGLRYEGVPVHDLVGASNGLRRPGHNLSIEPGLNYRFKATTIYTYVPIIISRKIRQNNTDASATKMTGIYRMGSGGSGNYAVFVGVLFKF